MNQPAAGFIARLTCQPGCNGEGGKSPESPGGGFMKDEREREVSIKTHKVCEWSGSVRKTHEVW